MTCYDAIPQFTRTTPAWFWWQLVRNRINKYHLTWRTPYPPSRTGYRFTDLNRVRTASRIGRSNRFTDSASIAESVAVRSWGQSTESNRVPVVMAPNREARS